MWVTFPKDTWNAWTPDSLPLGAALDDSACESLQLNPLVFSILPGSKEGQETVIPLPSTSQTQESHSLIYQVLH